MNCRSGFIGSLQLKKSEVRVLGTCEIRVCDLIVAIIYRGARAIDLVLRVINISGVSSEHDMI